MFSSLLVTKLFFPPPRPNLVPRPRLVGRLKTGLRGPLTLLAAPAGYGKTTLLGEWRAGEQVPPQVAWLSLDAGDNELFRFLLYLSAAIETVQPGLVQHTGLLLQSPQLPATDHICTTLLNELSTLNSEFILALDDYHVITNPEVHTVLAFLLDHLLPHLRLVLLTRADPPLPLARLRARGQLVEIRTADLRFTTEEASRFLIESMGLNLSPQDVAALEIRTEGWIAGLQLAALSMEGREDVDGFIAAFSGSHQYIVDYLAEEVLHRQPEYIRDFLLKTSILERLSGSLCEALTGRQEGQATLEMLAASNLFLIPLDHERRWFRYHHLFMDLLRNRLRTAAPDALPDLHRRASAWFDQEQMPLEAIEHALDAQEYQEVRRLMRTYFPRWWRAENWRRIFQWFGQFPDDFLKSEPWLCVIYAWMLWNRGVIEETEKYLDAAESALVCLASAGKLPIEDIEYDGLPAEILAFRAMVTTQKGQPGRVIKMANQALSIAPEKAHTVRAVAYNALQVVYRETGKMDQAIEACKLGLPEALAGGQIGTIVTAYRILGGTLTIQGKLSQAAAVYRQGLTTAETRSEARYPTYSLLRLHLADLNYLWNQIEITEDLLKQSQDLLESAGNTWGMVYLRYLLCLVKLASGDRLGIPPILLEMEQIASRVPGAYYTEGLKTMVIMIKARLGMVNRGDLEDWIVPGTLPKEPTTTQLEHMVYQAHVLVYLSSDSPPDILGTLAEIENIASHRGHMFWVIEIKILEAMVWQKFGSLDHALASLERALALAEPEAIIRLFLDEGEPIQKLLLTFISRSKNKKLIHYAQTIFQAFGTGSDFQVRTKQPLIDQLSDRELEVLALIAAGHSNKEIASQLVIALGTVKRHTVNVFNKLDVKNRTEAVAKARKLGILEP